MSTAMKSCEIPGRELEEVREKDPNGRIVVHHRTVDTLRAHAEVGSHRPGHVQCREGLPGCLYDREPRPNQGAADTTGAGHTDRERERPAARRPSPSAQGHAGAGWHLETGWIVRVARRWSAAERPRVGPPPGLGGRPVRQEQAQGI